MGGVFESLTSASFVINNTVLGSPFALSNVSISDRMGIGIVTGDKRSLTINRGEIGTIDLPLNYLEKAEILNCRCDTILLRDAHKKDSLLSIEKVTFKHLLFRKVFNYGQISLKELKISKDAKVSLLSSNLGKTDFINCRFSGAILEFENSKIVECFLSESDFPENILINGAKNYAQAQLAFGQLTTAFQKQGDTIRALEYQAREVEAHFWGITPWHSDPLTKFNLGLNWLSNDFGRNWLRGVFFSFSVGVIFFVLILMSSCAFFCIPKIQENLVSTFLMFMNPLRFIDLERLFSELKLNNWSYLWDFLGRIAVAYGYYQTIQAFRRFGRK